ncbi:MAG TPA: hypothetical protein VNO31_22775 [Umezawaea sp.]|nr:hypothetical protein [Umezawaea sp.]
MRELPDEQWLLRHADTVVDRIGVPYWDGLAVGLKALAGGDHEEARRSLEDVVRNEPRNLHAHYYLALALLEGKRPRRHGSELIKEVGVHLRHAADLPQAGVLSALVKEDHGLHWLPSDALPAELIGMIARMDPGQTAEILVHVPAPESGVWTALRNKVG